MTYTPRSGSVADRAHQVLLARGEMSGADLADEIEVEFSILMPSLLIPLKQGFIAKRLVEGRAWYRVGDGKPLPVPADDDPPRQVVVPADQAKPIVQKLTELDEQIKTFPKPQNAAAPAPKPELDPFRVAIWSDGTMQIRRPGGHQVLFTADETRAIVRYVERLGCDV